MDDVVFVTSVKLYAMNAAAALKKVRRRLPEPVFFVLEEGGDLIPFKQAERTQFGKLVSGYPAAVHAIYFSDGSVFDTANGWRPESRRARHIETMANNGFKVALPRSSKHVKPRVRVPMGRAVH